MAETLAIDKSVEFNQCILSCINQERRKKGYPALSEPSLELLKDSLRVVLQQVQSAMDKIIISPDSILHFNIVLSEISKCISVHNQTYKANTAIEIKNNLNKDCFKFQTSNLYQLIQREIRCYYLSLIDQNNKLSEVYLVLNELINLNAHTANFFYKQVNFRCVEMVIKTLKGGY